MSPDESASEPGVLSGVTMPAPWLASRVVESPHPVRDGYRHRQPVTVPGAKNLWLAFDARCATQYDYDKVVVFSGAANSLRKGTFKRYLTFFVFSRFLVAFCHFVI